MKNDQQQWITINGTPIVTAANKTQNTKNEKKIKENKQRHHFMTREEWKKTCKHIAHTYGTHTYSNLNTMNIWFIGNTAHMSIGEFSNNICSSLIIYRKIGSMFGIYHNKIRKRKKIIILWTPTIVASHGKINRIDLGWYESYKNMPSSWREWKN